MIPSEWAAYYRAEDGELVGYLVPVEGSTESFVPVTVFGHPLAKATDVDGAQEVLESCGLAYLAEPWLLCQAEADPIRIQIVEASPDRLLVRNVDPGAEGDMGTLMSLNVPEAGILRRA